MADSDYRNRPDTRLASDKTGEIHTPKVLASGSKAVARQEAGVFELVGINEQLDASRFSGSVAVPLLAGASGEIETVGLFTRKTGSGAILVPAGTLWFFNADPVITLDDAALAALVNLTVLGTVDVAVADWIADANGATFTSIIKILFPTLSNVYCAFFLNAAEPSFNDAGADDELLECNFWYTVDNQA